MKQSTLSFSAILKLQDQTNDKLQSLGSRANNGHKVVQRMYNKPIIDAEIIKEAADVSMPTAYALIADLIEKLGILHEITGGRRGRVYIFSKYMKNQ